MSDVNSLLKNIGERFAHVFEEALREFILKENIPELDAFINAIITRIREKQGVHGDAWRTCVLGRLRDKLTEEYKEWRLAAGDNIYAETEINTRKELGELVDLVTVCFFLFSRLKKQIGEVEEVC